MRPLSTAGTAVAALAIVLSACAPAAGTASSAASLAPSAAATVAASTAASTAASPSASAASAASPIAVPSGQLAFADKLVICSDLPYPPQEFFDASGSPIGSDIEIGQEIGKRLGVSPVIQNSVFDTIIAALASGKCDIIVSAQNITTSRVAQVDMIPYFKAGQSFVVASGNPAGIKVQNDLCGKKIAAETGTTEIDYLQGSGDYKGQGLSAACTKANLPPINVKSFGKDSDALLALSAGQVDAYFADSPVAGYYTVQHPTQFALSGLTLGVALEGISVGKANSGLRDAVQQALLAMINDSTYQTILKKYGVESGAVTATDVMALNKTK